MKNHNIISKPIDIDSFPNPLSKKQCDRYKTKNCAVITWKAWENFRDKWLK